DVAVSEQILCRPVDDGDVAGIVETQQCCIDMFDHHVQVFMLCRTVGLYCPIFFEQFLLCLNEALGGGFVIGMRRGAGEVIVGDIADELGKIVVTALGGFYQVNSQQNHCRDAQDGG